MFLFFTRRALCKAGLLDDGEFGLYWGCRGGRWWRGRLWLHGDWGALSGEAVGGLNPAGVSR